MSRPQPKTTPAASKAPNRVPAAGPRTVVPIKGPAKPQTPVSKPSAYKPPTKAPASKTAAPRPSAAKPAARPAAPRPATAKPAPAKAAPAAAANAGNWINRTIQNSVAGVGSTAANLIYSVGNSVNKVGEGVGGSITNTSRYWGQGVAGYGNDIKDSVGVGGARIATAGNPLGMAGVGQGKAAPPSVKKPADAGASGGGPKFF